MDVLVCVKRVPVTGGRISLTDDEQDIDTRYLGFTVSPHEECAVEEAVRLVETHGGSSTVLTLGPAVAEDQLALFTASSPETERDRGLARAIDRVRGKFGPKSVLPGGLAPPTGPAR